MLAQNFMTAEALGISDVQLEALIKTLGVFERGEIPADQFFMAEWAEQCDAAGTAIHCGSAMCIGGWAEVIGKLPLKSLMALAEDGTNIELFRLFFPAYLLVDDLAKGAHALRNYLTTGEARWKEVMNVG